MESELTISQFVDYVTQIDPDLWRICYPRIYKNTDQYGSPKVPAAALASSMLLIKHGVPSPISMNVCMAADMLSRFDFPHLFIHKELLSAVSLTEPPSELRWDTVSMPYDAATLMLPKGWLKYPEGGYCEFISYARIRPKTEMYINGEELVTSKDTFMVFTMRNVPPKMISTLTINSEQTPYVSTKDLPLVPIENVSEFDAPLTPDEDSFMADCMSLVFRILLALESRPTLLSAGQRVGVSHKKSGRQPLEIWTPNIIGLNYRRTTTKGTGEGGHKRMHWRRGHFTRQVYGPRRSLRKTLWIEPVLVGG